MRSLLSLIVLALGTALFFLASSRLPALGVVIGLATGYLAWPAAYFGALAVSGATTRDLSLRPTVLWTSLFSAMVLMVESLVIVLFDGAWWWLGAALGWGLALGTFVLAARLWLAPLRPIFALRAALENPAAVDRAAENLARSFEAGPRHPSGIAQRRSANRAIAAVAVLSEARRWPEARRVLDTIPIQGLDRLRRAALQASRATVLLYAGDKNAAWAALRDAYANADDASIRRLVILTDALLSALDGHSNEALTRLAQVPEPNEPRVQRAWLIAKSQALAGAGRMSEARECLEALARNWPDGLTRVMELGGPAASLARRLDPTRG
jgi:tetratricopeptide (TPR) repeat protein